MDPKILLRCDLLASLQSLGHQSSDSLIHHHLHSLPQFLPLLDLLNLLLELIIAEVQTPAFPHFLGHDPHLQSA